MVAIRLMVRAVAGREAADFAKDVELAAPPPFPGLALAEGRGGEASPLFVVEVRFSAVFARHLVRCEDDVADDAVGGIDEVIDAYAREGWQMVRRASLHACRPRSRRAAS